MASRTVKLLAVDDVVENLAALEALIARPGVELCKVRSGTEALELLLQDEVALALIDVQMPEMDGFELAELMRGSPRTRHVPIIFLTAGTRDRGRLFRGYEAGAVDFLYKPLDPHILRSKVEVFIELQRQKDALAENVELLREALRLNEMFTAVLGHDLRNPLSAILTGAALIQRKSEEEATLRCASRIQSSASRMGRMIEQLLDLARLRSSGGRIVVKPVPADLRDLCAQTIEEIEAARGRAPSLEAAGDTKGHWDLDRLLQVLSNLIGNAVRHGSPEQPITVRVDGTRASELVVVIHNGGAVPATLLPHLFEPFQSGRREQGSDGLGLGLYIARQMVEAHGGALQVRSSPADGTTFEVRLPRLALTSAPPAPSRR